mmetsp:Transcript_98926/g.284151  ORF Transcript_98926/g.284151 Transcript_98926/m.284151 type:complete len:194 (-) Transcript_98926:1994-2575(-)
MCRFGTCRWSFDGEESCEDNVRFLGRGEELEQRRVHNGVVGATVPGGSAATTGGEGTLLGPCAREASATRTSSWPGGAGGDSERSHGAGCDSCDNVAAASVCKFSCESQDGQPRWDNAESRGDASPTLQGDGATLDPELHLRAASGPELASLHRRRKRPCRPAEGDRSAPSSKGDDNEASSCDLALSAKGPRS